MSLRQSDLEKRAKTRLGTVVRGKYRLDGLLGIGGMAAVYRATHRNQAELAIKMLHPELSLYEDFKRRFLREGYAANSVKHPSVVAVLDDDVAEDGSAFLVMELLHGSSVDALRKARGRLSPLQAVAVGHQVLDVLRAAHDKGIVHRDIKPANLFVIHDGTVKVLDFGIARARDEAAPEEQATGTGVLLGTPAFMAPEQANAKASEIDGRTDIWALGATLFTLLSGKSVHQADNPTRALVSAASLPAPHLCDVEPSVPPSIAAVVDRALEFERDKRWADAKSMRRALVDACQSALGEVATKGTLAELVGPMESPSVVSTRRDGDEALLPGAAGETRALPLEAMLQEKGIAAPAPPPAVPMSPAEAAKVEAQEALLSPLASTTAQPVSSVSTLPGQRGPAPARKGLWAAVALVACGGLVVASAVRALVHSPATATAAVTAETRAAEPVSAAMANAPPPPAPPPPTPPTAADPAPAPAPAAPSAPAVEAVEAPKPAAREAAPSVVAAEAPAPKAPRKAAPAAKRADCNPNFTLDKEGNKHFKPECF